MTIALNNDKNNQYKTTHINQLAFFGAKRPAYRSKVGHCHGAK